ncbi:MAG: hypothetical protein AB7F40_10235 [Victivallaceae bacterium]
MIKLELLEEVHRAVIDKPVWVIAYGWMPCPECAGTGTVDYTAKNGTAHTIECPECGGTRCIKFEGHRVLAQTIKSVDISSTEIVVRCPQYSFFDNCDGSFPDLFATEAEAQAECDRLNKEAADEQVKANKKGEKYHE